MKRSPVHLLIWKMCPNPLSPRGNRATPPAILVVSPPRDAATTARDSAVSLASPSPPVATTACERPVRLKTTAICVAKPPPARARPPTRAVRTRDHAWLAEKPARYGRAVQTPRPQRTTVPAAATTVRRGRNVTTSRDAR